ncbi:MAG TPA: cell wall-binding repeat-containing protein [Candidatus Limnocylindria bacterium]|nr:cell wall-binding repeat-containing protein [Candidatus Limnocylindria bacterium]
MVVVGVLSALLGAGPAGRDEVRAATDRLPDLRMVPLSDFRIETTSAGRRLLRFTATMANVGRGAFELRGSRPSASSSTMSVQQVIYNDAGGARSRVTSAVMRYAGDGHNHWHVQKIMHYEARSLSGIRRPTEKTDFCFFDTQPYSLSLPGAPQRSVYAESGCGTSSSLATRVGISVGWADSYPWNFVGQWIDVTGVPAGEYIIHAEVDPNRHFAESAEGNNCAWTRVSIPASGSAVSVLSRGSRCMVPVTRLAGTDRYTASAAVSASAFAPDPAVAYVASGENFPDALAAGAAAGHQRGPVLLVRRAGVPTAIANELVRLRPSRIVVVGGPATIPDTVLAELDRYDAGGGVTRIGGADRYEAAAALSASVFAPDRPVAYVATGENFPDGLTAVPVAARQGGPLLLVRAGSIPDSTRAELLRLRPAAIAIVGGPASVSDAVMRQLDDYDTGRGVRRYTGSDRYAASAVLSAAAFPGGAPVGYLASGENFPDALSAGPAAALRGAPVLLVKSTTLPAATAAELNRLAPKQLFVVGGPASVSGAVIDAAAAAAY